MLGNLKSYGAVLGIVLAFVGFLGFQVIVDALARRVEKAAKDDLESIRARTQTALVDLELAVREGERASSSAAEQVATLRQRHTELEDLSTKYRALHEQVQLISTRVEAAASAAAQSQDKVAGLGVALSNTFSGSPALFMSSFDWSSGEGTIQGKNFGATPGRVHVEFSRHFDSTPAFPAKSDRMDSIEVAGSEIREWSDSAIMFQLSEASLRAVRAFKTEYEEVWSKFDPARRGERSLDFEFTVERVDGKRGSH